MLFHPTKTVLVLKDFFQKTESAYFLFIFIFIEILEIIYLYIILILYIRCKKPDFYTEFTMNFYNSP